VRIKQNDKAEAANHQAFGWVGQLGPLVLSDNCALRVDAWRYVTSAVESVGSEMVFLSGAVAA
jgi:hypothetical protein